MGLGWPPLHGAVTSEDAECERGRVEHRKSRSTTRRYGITRATVATLGRHVATPTVYARSLPDPVARHARMPA